MDTKTIISGTLLAQILLGIIMFVAAQIMEVSRPRTAIFRGEPTRISLGSELLVLLLVTIGVLVFTEELSSSWIGLFKNTSFVGIPRDLALPIVFVIDIVITSRLVGVTGGSTDSPFQPIFFLIPTLALLLYEPSARIAIYAFLVSAAFILLLRAAPLHLSARPAGRLAYSFVSIACLALSVVIGLLTRSCPDGLC